MHIGLKIKELRKLKLLTQEQLADISGVSDRTVRRLESNGTAENATLVSILEALNTNLHELENMFNDDETIKEESKEKYADLSFLHRIETGRELVRIIGKAHQYGYDYHDCTSDEQIEAAQVFLSEVADVLDIWDMLEIGQKFNCENDLTKHIKSLEDQGLWVFGDRQISNNNSWITAIIEIYSKDNPMIQKVKLDKNVMQKGK
jgi:transcriptional regulator with XRE-family HTH domain